MASGISNQIAEKEEGKNKISSHTSEHTDQNHKKNIAVS